MLNCPSCGRIFAHVCTGSANIAPLVAPVEQSTCQAPTFSAGVGQCCAHLQEGTSSTRLSVTTSVVGGVNHIQMIATQTLPTPSVSGHMFHFPLMQLQPLQPLQLQPPFHFSVPSPAVQRLPDNAEWSRRHTSGGGLIHSLEGLRVHVQDRCKSTDDGTALMFTREALAECGWYWSSLSWREADTLLQDSAIGTFLVRDSSDPQFLYSLSVKTEKGPTSVRIHYSAGKFRLDSDHQLVSSIPEFDSLPRLVEYYIRVNKRVRKHVWVNSEGRMYSPITIRHPLRDNVASLKHLCRVCVHLCTKRTASLSGYLPNALCQYLNDYPFAV